VLILVFLFAKSKKKKRYGPGDRYAPHGDFHLSRRTTRGGEQRTHTLLVYLSDLDPGTIVHRDQNQDQAQDQDQDQDQDQEDHEKGRQKEEETSINNPGGAASPGGWLVGGATAFTKLLPSGEPLRVLPRAGNAIYWSNLRAHRGERGVVMVPSLRSVHTGEALAPPPQTQTAAAAAAAKTAAASGNSGGGGNGNEDGTSCSSSSNAVTGECAEPSLTPYYKYALNVWVVDEPFDFDAIRSGTTSSNGNDPRSAGGGGGQQEDLKFRIDLDDDEEGAAAGEDSHQP
jgi:hypothetical protein